MHSIPAIDLIDGKCVRLTEGDYDTKKIYNENPAEVAKQFQDAGVQRLHMVDLDGAKAGAPKNLKVLETVAKATNLTIDFGGGLKQDDDLRDVFNAGASMASIGSVAVKKPDVFAAWIKKYGATKVILGADVRDEKIAVAGWLETTDINLFDFLGEKITDGVKYCFVTDISKDGKLQGAATELYKKIKNQYPNLYLIASGGVSNLADLEELKLAGLDAAIVGKAIYEGRISMKELENFIVQS